MSLLVYRGAQLRRQKSVNPTVNGSAELDGSIQGRPKIRFAIPRSFSSLPSLPKLSTLFQSLTLASRQSISGTIWRKQCSSSGSVALRCFAE